MGTGDGQPNRDLALPIRRRVSHTGAGTSACSSITDANCRTSRPPVGGRRHMIRTPSGGPSLTDRVRGGERYCPNRDENAVAWADRGVSASAANMDLAYTMADEDTANPRPHALGSLSDIGSRAAAAALRPFTDAAAGAVDVGIDLERRAVDRVLDSSELERILDTAFDSPRIQAALLKAIDGDGAKRLVTGLFDSGLFDDVVDGLLKSEALWRLVDEIADSPAVTAAITQQGLGFVEQMGDEVRARSRSADDRLEHAARRLRHRKAEEPPSGQAKDGSQSTLSIGPNPPSGATPPVGASAAGESAPPPADRGRGGDAPVFQPARAGYVGLVTRTIAFVMDAIVIDLVALVVAAGAALIVSVLHLPTQVLVTVVVGGVAFILWSIAYFVAFWAMTGQTPGDRMMRLRVVATSGKLNPRRAFLRWIGMVLSALLLFVGYLVIPFDRRRRGWHDRLARTVVVEAPGISQAELRRRRKRAVALATQPAQEAPQH
jgi:uncharacterized RDD family membrane protein YckC